MSEEQSLINHIAAWAREELGALRSLTDIVNAQGEAAVKRDPTRLEELNEELMAVTRKGVGRERRRRALIEAAAARLQVPASATTLGSLAERFGEEGHGLDALRVELRTASADLLRAQRRTRRLLALHHEVTREVLERLLGGDGRSPLENGGVLVDAEV